MAQAYRWTLDDIRKLTYPQILMLNAAAETNRKRMDARIKRKRADGTMSIQEEIADMPLVNGKRFDELTSDELLASHVGEGPKPRIIKAPKKG